VTTGGGRTQSGWVVSGRVQGVGFRWFVYHHATKLGLTGWVKNLSDGRVEVVASGPGEARDALFMQLQRGPFGARVDNVESVDYQHEPDQHIAFEIK
jgi:acylphosphatase